MNVFNYYLGVLQNYAKFDGRARRSEYWYFMLINIVVVLALSFIGSAIGFDYLDGIYGLGVMVPAIGVAIRRMHDVGKSGWFCLIPLYNFILAVTDGEKGANQYGENPKGE
jgi:uncharacterized membrane protein YhaH (DUF805 family)